MSDGKNEARVLRILELANDVRTLTVHINEYLQRPMAQPPDSASQQLIGYVVLRDCEGRARALAASPFAPPSMPPSDNTDSEKMRLVRLNYNFSVTRFKLHNVYLRVAAAVRWIQYRAQILQGAMPQPRQAAALQAIDDRLRQDIGRIIDTSVFQDLRKADRMKGYWIDEDPDLPKIQALMRADF